MWICDEMKLSNDSILFFPNKNSKAMVTHFENKRSKMSISFWEIKCIRQFESNLCHRINLMTLKLKITLLRHKQTSSECNHSFDIYGTISLALLFLIVLCFVLTFSMNFFTDKVLLKVWGLTWWVIVIFILWNKLNLILVPLFLLLWVNVQKD